MIPGNPEAGIIFLLAKCVCVFVIDFFLAKLYATEIFSTGSTRAQPHVLRRHNILLKKRSKNNEKEEGHL